jgi:aminoglycoside phosphotransferase (APT) family kinase protein
MPIDSLTAAQAAELLGGIGVAVDPGELVPELRDERWLVRLPGQRVAWLARSAAGRVVLLRERRVLRLLAARCGFEAPRILFADTDGDVEVRSMVAGANRPWQVYEAARADGTVARQLGTQIGAILAEQHTRVGAADVAGWLPDRPSWPEPRGWIAERLTRVVDDPELVATADAVVARYDAVTVDERDRVLVHGDVGFHNVGIDDDNRTVHGIFDYAAPAFADRHHDFRYLVFDFDRRDLLDAARAAYEPIAGRVIDTDRVLLYNAACAITFLAYRDGTPPEADSCGRTLDQDLRWSRHAVARVLGESAPAPDPASGSPRSQQR